ncbi:hypothetical protein STRCI_000685 [Streptomyces cinnabarinus]|uniref:Uncharacterized protein n=1 Tax=Streptomyces cinnabarinus TaxID=67287 RepID=A0ABY7K555_9ACTN|nr:hypothetical protein [Streptomyces cinnabarinus]WAZ19622.1 hypothetical protein STRCI_000685 [Streptomyces cinnabarinus]
METLPSRMLADTLSSVPKDSRSDSRKDSSKYVRISGQVYPAGFSPPAVTARQTEKGTTIWSRLMSTPTT